MHAVWGKTTGLGTAFMLSGFVFPSVGNGFKSIWLCKHVIDNSSCWNLNLQEVLKLLIMGWRN